MYDSTLVDLTTHRIHYITIYHADKLATLPQNSLCVSLCEIRRYNETAAYLNDTNERNYGTLAITVFQQ